MIDKDKEKNVIRIYIRITDKEYSFVKDITNVQGIDLRDWMRSAIGCKLESDGLDGSIFFAPPVSESE
jgi:hypothetical protein